MKKIFIYCILLSIIVSACKKDKKLQPESTDSLYPVSFNVSNFNQDIEPITQNNLKTNDIVSPEKAGILKVLYRLYDSNDKLVKTKELKKGNPLFPSIKDSLSVGKYSAVFVGLTDTVNFWSNNDHFIYKLDEWWVHYTVYAYRETFYKKINFTIGSTGFQQGITLERLNAEVQVVFKDAIPNGLTSVTISTPDCVGFNYFDGTPYPDPSNKVPHSVISNIPANKIGTTNFATAPLTNINSTGSPINIIIEASFFGGVGNLKKTIQGVQLKRNTRTILTGNVFSGSSSSSSSFNITFQPLNPNDLLQSY